MYNKVNVQRHREERECPCCGKKWTIWVQKSSDKYWRCCTDCVHKYTPHERHIFLMNKSPKDREKYLNQKRQEFLKHYTKQILHRTKLRAEKKNMEFNLEESDIIIPKICPILEVPIQIGTKDNYEYSPSIDRIDNSKGYIKGNIQIISKKANSMKNSASPQELQTFCKNILRYSLNTVENECSESKDKEP